MVFNLSDSFYSAIRRADVVALETNPESWQDDMFNFNFENDFVKAAHPWTRGVFNAPKDYLTINSLKFSKYEKLIEAALASNPAAINNLLYRTYSENETDFEEDTYLDLYIYQAGKKWGKKIYGVENYAESMKLAMEAYVDAMKDKNKKEKTYDSEDDYSFVKLQEAYRTGNLDLLDTINRLNSLSPAFDEKFLYRRNDIQAASIDSILKTGMSLFVGVGAAHLPGHRGVIEILRNQGYKLRPIKMGERNSRFKDEIEKVIVPVAFLKQTSDDGFYTVEVPGKLYRYSNTATGFDQHQYADMANGSYYVVTRIQTNTWAWGDTLDEVFKKVDSVLYENIPGRILSKKIISKNGYRGFDIINRTRRGDHQRYNIFITPFEVLFFKVSGNGDYVSNTKAADQFFNSLSLKEYTSQWKKLSPVFGGFEVEMPHEPYVIKNKNWQFLATDKIANIDFQVIRTDVHNYDFAAEDSFDLSLMEESYTASDFFESSISRRQTTYKGYPALDAKYRYKDGSIALVRYLIQGPHYYTITSHAKKEDHRMIDFLNSFTITPFVYKQPELKVDTSLHFTVETPYYPASKNKIEMPGGYENIYAGMPGNEEILERATYRDKLIKNDSTGERIYVSFYKAPRYEEQKDSIDIKKEIIGDDKDWIIKQTKTTLLPNGMKMWESMLSDSNSSRVIWVKTYYRNGLTYIVKTETDSLSKPGSFLSSFFSSFQPTDTVLEINAANKPSAHFFEDFYSSDTALRKRAISSITKTSFDSTDLGQLKNAIASLNWRDRNYLSAKKDFVDQLGTIPTATASSYLKEIFYAAGDTVELQYKTLQNLLNQQSKISFGTFRDIVATDPPILNLNSFTGKDNDYNEELFLDALYDSLELTSSIATDLLPLLNIDDYKYPIIELMARLVNNNLLSYKDYETYVSKFLLEAKQALKKQTIIEKNRDVEKAQKNNKTQGPFGDDQVLINSDREYLSEYGNETLSEYAVLLMPGWKKNKAIPDFLNLLLATNDKRLKYKTMLLFIKNERPVADSIINDFAADNNYRYELYEDLSRLDASHRFPARHKNQLDLAISKLLNSNEYNKPDSVVFLAKKGLKWDGADGLIYFFKYKRKKSDDWKLATVGLIQKDSAQFEFRRPGKRLGYDFNLDFTEFSNERVKENEPLEEQLNIRLRKLTYAKRPSAKEFYKSEEAYDYSDLSK